MTARLFLSLMVLAWFARCPLGNAQDAGGVMLDDAPIRASVGAYAAAFNKHDADALAAMWTEDAVYTNLVTGESANGRPAIAAQFKQLFEKNQSLQMALETDAIQYLSPHVAVEHGTAKILSPELEPELYQYTAVYVKQGDKWLLDRVTDQEAQAAPYHEHLKQLEWMIGSWTGGEEGADLQLTCSWTTNKSFITRSFSIFSGTETFTGTQIVGWDPVAKSIRCWTFDEDGAFAEGTWTKNGDTWTLYNKGVLQDGTKVAMINVMKQLDDNTFTWKTIDRIAGGEIKPNLPEITVVRDLDQ